MHIPFFSQEDNLQAFKKMKVLFLINRIRCADFFIFLFWMLPFALNLIYFIIMKGQNELSKVWCPYGSMFVSSPAISDWSNTWYGLLHLVALIGIVVWRIRLAKNLLRRMKQYKQENRGFTWNKNSKLWRVVFVPFISFVVYPILLKATATEISHKYNW